MAKTPISYVYERYDEQFTFCGESWINSVSKFWLKSELMKIHFTKKGILK
jgi:hypothetical protein